MHEQPPDIRVLAEALAAHRLNWVLVGGAALVLHGGDFVTTDTDVAFAPDMANVDALAAALNDLHARPVRIADGVPFTVDRFILGAPYLRFRTDAGIVDLLRRLPGIESFAALRSKAKEIELGNVKMLIASLDDLITMKQQSDRTKDKLHLMELQALKKIEEGSGT